MKTDETLTAEDAGRRYDVGQLTVLYAIQRGELPAVRGRTGPKVRLPEFERWLSLSLGKDGVRARREAVRQERAHELAALKRQSRLAARERSAALRRDAIARARADQATFGNVAGATRELTTRDSGLDSFVGRPDSDNTLIRLADAVRVSGCSENELLNFVKAGKIKALQNPAPGSRRLQSFGPFRLKRGDVLAVAK